MTPTTLAPLSTLAPLAERAGWHETHVIDLPARSACTVPLDALPSSEAVKRYLRVVHPQGVYLHQADAAACASEFENFAVTTGTASGKTKRCVSIWPPWRRSQRCPRPG